MTDEIKMLFFNETLKRWHFELIVKESGLSRERVNYYLKRLLKSRFIQRIKPRGRMPYYVANRDNPVFRMEKRLYGLNILAKNGLFEHICSLEDIKTAVLFGSFSRGDWNKESDIDLFLFGDTKNFEKGKYESKLKRKIGLLGYQGVKKIKKDLDPKLIPNIAKGFNIKGDLEPFEVILNA